MHTPESIVQHYGSRNEETWSRFLRALEALPPQFKVLGINDYIFLDGYKRVLSEKRKGRLANIDLLLPVVELRLDKFGGTESGLSRVNFHVIFSDELEPQTIEQQFINALPRSYKLSPQFAGLPLEWSGVPTKASLEDLGRKIIASVPAQERSRFGSPLIEGFNNLNLSLEPVLEVLDSSYFKGKHLTAVGKTEWWNIKWNDKSIADKKNIINSVDLVFIACDTAEDYNRARESLRKAEVNSRLLDCSDAHWFRESAVKDRLGSCLTWLKADPTFQGLKHVVIEPEERVFVGSLPQQLQAVRDNPTRYIASVTIKNTLVSGKGLDEVWFDTDLQLNQGLVAVIGNKGSGKSALVDVIGLLGNSRSQATFSFLNKEKFRKPPENKAKYFKGTITWASSEAHSARLDRDIAPGEVERIKYIPQNYFEEICTQLPGIEDTAFDKELKAVIFSHVGEADRLGKAALEELVAYKSNEIDEALRQARHKVEKVSTEIAALEEMLTPDYRTAIANGLQTKKGELRALEKSRPPKVRKPSKQSLSKSETLDRADKRKGELEEAIDSARERRKELADMLTRINKVRGKLHNLEEEVEALREDLSDTLAGVGVTPDEILRVQVVTEPLDKLERGLTKERDRLELQLDRENEKGLLRKLDEVKRESVTLREEMDKPSKEYEQYKERVSEWEARKREIVGDRKIQGTIANLEARIEELKEIPGRLSQLYEKRRKHAKAVYKCLRKHKTVLAELYSPVQRFITEHPDIGKKIDLNFAVSIINVGFEEGFLEWINQSRTGAFMGAVDGRRLAGDVAARYNFDDEDSAVAFADEIAARLRGEEKGGAKTSPSVAEQLKKGKTVHSLYTFIYSFGYLSPRYVLRLGEKDLRQLSPGERGALLIVFYLLVDLDTTPLIIDQPEHNLDNETVTKLLVPAIRKAKQRRQILIVTHNPILAVVCNADRVIAASMDITANYRVEYSAGAIENPVINRRIVDVLEGTMPAFDNRHRKYMRDYLEAYEKAAWE